MATGLSQFHFLRPWWLLALVPALWLVWIIRRHQDAARPWRGVIADHLLPHLLTEGGPRRRLQPVHLLLPIWLLAILALSGPTWQREPSPLADDEAALVIAIEVTPDYAGAGYSAVAAGTRGTEDSRSARPRPGTRTALVAYPAARTW